jgi:hypothetical protein
MKNNKTIFILIGIFAICFIGASIFFALQGILAASKEQKHFDVYRQKAAEYIKSDPELLDQYGDKVSIKFDNSVTYSRSPENVSFNRFFMEVFNPSVPDSLDEFIADIDMIRFNVRINGNPYQITFEKNNQGELVVSDLKEIE